MTYVLDHFATADRKFSAEVLKDFSVEKSCPFPSDITDGVPDSLASPGSSWPDPALTVLNKTRLDLAPLVRIHRLSL